ncbi:MAG: RNA polymerase sigma factor [Bacteroidota bacterium]
MRHPSEDIFLNIIEEYKAIVYKIANLYARTTEDQEDLFQEIIINLWKAYPSFKGHAKISTWIYQISLNTAITNYRREKKKVRYESISMRSLNEIGAPSEEHEIDQLTILYQAVDDLHKIDKAIVLLYLEQKSYQEISQIMGMTVAATGMRIKRIKSKLAERFAKMN